MLTITKTMKWDRITAAYFGLRKRQHSDEFERALFLQQLREVKPWLQRRRYTSQAVYVELSEYTFEDIVHHVLGESVKEVNNTIRVLDTFGKTNFRKFGRKALLRVLNRAPTAAVRRKILAAMEKSLKKRENSATPGLPTSTVGGILRKYAPKPRKVDAFTMARKLKQKNKELRAELREKNAEIAALKRELAKAKRKKRAA